MSAPRSVFVLRRPSARRDQRFRNKGYRARVGQCTFPRSSSSASVANSQKWSAVGLHLEKMPRRDVLSPPPCACGTFKVFLELVRSRSTLVTLSYNSNGVILISGKTAHRLHD